MPTLLAKQMLLKAGYILEKRSGKTESCYLVGHVPNPFFLFVYNITVDQFVIFLILLVLGCILKKQKNLKKIINAAKQIFSRTWFELTIL